MYREERIKIIMDYLNKYKSISVEKMSKELFMSEATVRRDLTYLEDNNIVKRTHGGAVLYSDISQGIPLFMRKKTQQHEKLTIAEIASHFVKDGDVIFIDDSSTAANIVPFLIKYNNIVVITNSVKTALDLCDAGIPAYCTGGLLSPKSYSCLDSFSTNLVKNINADLFFFSTTGLDENGDLTDTTSNNSNLGQTVIKRQMLLKSKVRILLCDSSKLGQTYAMLIANLNELDYIVTDRSMDSSYASKVSVILSSEDAVNAVQNDPKFFKPVRRTISYEPTE